MKEVDRSGQSASPAMSDETLTALAALGASMSPSDSGTPVGVAQDSPYAFLADEHKLRVLEAATQVFAAEGYDGASLAKIAKAAGLSQSGLLHHFHSKEALLVAVLAMRDAEAASQFPLTEIPSLVDVADSVAAMFAGQLQRPMLVALFAKMSADATNPQHPAHAWAVQRYAFTCGFYTRMVRVGVERGQIRAEVDAERVARNLVAVMDGLQLQYLLEPGSFDAAGEFHDYLRSVIDHIRA